MQNFFRSDNHFENPFFIGTVEDNNDPTFNYRVKVRIETLHPNTITTAQLPWAARVDTAFMGINDDIDLSHKVPEIGSKVLVLAINNNINSLIYLGCLYKKTNNTPINENYLNSYGIYRKNGQFIGIDKIKKLFQLLFEGSIIIDKIQDMTINATNSISITCQNATVKATKVTVDAPNTDITGNLNVAGNIVSAKEVSAKGGAVNLSTHTHMYEMGGTAAGTATTQPGKG